MTDNTATGAQVNDLIEGLDVDGDLVVSGNTSPRPRLPDWEGDASCVWDGITGAWGALDFVAHDRLMASWARSVDLERMVSVGTETTTRAGSL